ncbi:ribosomal protein S18-alanine N-acetyltransferase [Paraferrimonas sp. SM1919]|uniref:ribosomal protein S18-alanine N-acetyltransferase n=1 Tax=Paraferrimonas sp. SM1919 TaxID=2662263 RepID=UPI0013D7DF32|nr:ribosomal protein S18-alanine N-acetyltransferase [Paraferrimonas sp. SM1919]
MVLSIKRLNAEHIALLYGIETRAHKIPWSQSLLESSLNDKFGHTLGLYLDNQLIGFCVNQILFEEANLLNICIDPAYQGNGFGVSFMAQLKQYYLANKVEKVFLEVRASNHRAIKLYQKMGFEAMGLRKNYYKTLGQTKEDAQIMMWELNHD